MTPKEKFDYTVDCIDCFNIYITVRLTAGDQPLSFYSWSDARHPETFKVRLKDGKTFWMNSWEPETWPATSPGIEKLLEGSKGSWHKLAPHQSIQWKEVDTTHFAGQTRAYSAFIRIAQSSIQEIFSDSFLVPPDTNPPEPTAELFERGLSCLLTLDSVKALLREINIMPGGTGTCLYQSSEINNTPFASPDRINVLFLSPHGDRSRLFSFRIAQDGSILVLRGGSRLTHSKTGWSTDQESGSQPPDPDIATYVNHMVHDNPALKFHLLVNATHCTAE